MENILNNRGGFAGMYIKRCLRYTPCEGYAHGQEATREPQLVI